MSRWCLSPMEDTFHWLLMQDIMDAAIRKQFLLGVSSFCDNKDTLCQPVERIVSDESSEQSGTGD